MKTYLLLLVLSCSIYSCKKPVITNGNDMPPNCVFALLDKQGNDVFTNTSELVDVWFIQDGQRKYIGSECAGGGCTMVRENHNYQGKPLKYPYIYMSLGMSQVSYNGYKTFYIQQGGKVDTLFWDVQKTAPNDPLDQYDVVSVKFNNKLITIDQDELPVYPLQRRH